MAHAIAPGSGALVDAAGNVYTIDSGLNADENGKPIAGGSNTAAAEYSNGSLYFQDAGSKSWYTWNQTSWTKVGAPPSVAIKITPGSGAFTDTAKNVYTIDSSLNADENGKPIAGGSNTGALEYSDGTVYGQDATSKSWYVWSNGSWSGAASAPPSVSSSGATIRIAASGQSAKTINTAQVHTETDDGATISLTAPGVAKVVLGATSDSLSFSALSSIDLTAGSAASTVVATGGQNIFTAGSGALTVTGGSGKDSYVFHAGDADMSVTDFSYVKGDRLTLDSSLKSVMSEKTDGHGGTVISFTGSSGHIDLLGVPALATGSVQFA